MNVFNGSAETGSLIEVGSFGVLNGNYTYYDEFTKLVSPMIMTMWPKNSTTAWAPDTRLFCITASDIEAGSRVPGAFLSHVGTANLVIPTHAGHCVDSCTCTIVIENSLGTTAWGLQAR